MAGNSENQINLKTLQRVDPSIVEIIDHASQVAIYKYERKLEKWEGTDVEGTLFLYERSTYPHHGFIIVNRMNTTNFVESITSDMQFQLHEPYLLYKNHSGDIIGSWFYEYKDLERISKKIQTIVLKQTSTPKRQRCASESETPKDDIMALLCQANNQYMKSSNEGFSEKMFPQKPATTQEPISPRRRFLSAGSVDSRSSAEFIRSTEKEDERLSPLFSRSDISPISDIGGLDESFGQYHSTPSVKSSSQTQSKLANDWMATINLEKDNFACIKQVLKSHIEDNPGLLLKIHEAYVSSLRSIFSKT